MWTPVERHDARVVDLLVQDDEVVARLEELHVLVVARRDGRNHRRTRIPAQDASVPDAAVFRPVRQSRDPRNVGNGSLATERRKGRHLSVCRIHDERGALVVGVLRGVPKKAEGRVPDRGVRSPLFDVCNLFVSEMRSPNQCGGALEGRQRAEKPDPLQVGVSVGGPRSCPSGGRI